METDETQKILFLDDILQFSIATRRLIELTHLKSFSNRTNIVVQYFDDRETPVVIYPSKKEIGLLTLVNCVIHAAFIELFRNRLDYEPYHRTSALKTDRDKFERYRLFAKLIDENRWHEYSIEPAMLVETDKKFVGIVLLKDLVDASVVVAEKIVDACSDSKIFLGPEHRD